MCFAIVRIKISICILHRNTQNARLCSGPLHGLFPSFIRGWSPGLLIYGRWCQRGCHSHAHLHRQVSNSMHISITSEQFFVSNKPRQRTSVHSSCKETGKGPIWVWPSVCLLCNLAIVEIPWCLLGCLLHESVYRTVSISWLSRPCLMLMVAIL